ncbi:MAG: hypothetical protein GXO89_05205 [Chlorobi bacterium]|nr:hypothetical protein [Chlorobiota bacterium]
MKFFTANFKIAQTVSFFLFVILFTSVGKAYSENGGDDDKYNKGITVSPSHLNYKVDLGKTKTQKVKVANYTSKAKKFRVIYNDFDMTLDGKSQFLDAGTSKYSLSKYINIAPSFLELAPGESADISVTVTIPEDSLANKAAWGVLMIEQAEERQSLDPGNDGGNTVAFGITPTVAFGVWIYQNPPHVVSNAIEILDFSFDAKDQNKPKYLLLNVENTGDGISFCKSYVELTNLNTGEQQTLGGKNFTLLPGYKRIFFYEVLAILPKGKYSAVGVIDYGSNSEILAAELEIQIE